MTNLQEKIEKMLHGEQKRREVALKFLDELTENLKSVSMEMYGESGKHHAEPSPAVWVWKEKDGKSIETNIYFRYDTHYGEKDSEGCGFYFSKGDPYWGKDIAEEKGKDFWWALRTIIEWLPLFGADIEKKIESRNTIAKKLQRF